MGTIYKQGEYYSGGGGSGNFEAMSEEDVKDIKDVVNIDAMDVLETMASSDVEEIKNAFEVDPASGGVKSFNNREGDVLPTKGDYLDNQIILSSVLHIGGETQENVNEALIALVENSGGKGDFEAMSEDDVDDIKGAVEIDTMEVLEAMSPSDVEDIKNAFEIESGGEIKGDYEDLDNLPTVGGVTLIGDMSLSDLGAQGKLTFDPIPIQGSANPVTSGGIYTAIYEAIDGVLRASY